MLGQRVKAIIKLEVYWMYILYEVTGIGGNHYLLRFGEPNDIARIMLGFDSLLCLMAQGRSLGPEEDQKELNKIERLNKAYKEDKVTRKTLEKFSYSLSTGDHTFLVSADKPEEVEALVSYLEGVYAKRIERFRGTPLEKRFLEIMSGIRSEGMDPSENLVSKINFTQFIL